MRGTPIGILLLFCMTFAYDPSLINCVQPSEGVPSSLELNIQHRFGRALGDKATGDFLGGANVDMGLVWRAWKGLCLSANGVTQNSEFDLGGRWNQNLIKDRLDVAGEIQFFNFDRSALGLGRASNNYYLASICYQPLPDRIYLTIQDGYDGYYLYSAPSVAALVKCSESVDLIGEYCLRHDRYPRIQGRMHENVFSFGVKYNTWGHQFKLILSNSTSIGSRNASAGAPDNKLRIGFSIQRLFRLKEE